MDDPNRVPFAATTPWTKTVKAWAYGVTAPLDFSLTVAWG